MHKFLFFNIKKNWFLNILIIVTVLLWVVLFTQLVSLINFQNNFENSYKKFFPIKNGYVVSLNMFQIKAIDNKENKIKDVISYIDKNSDINYLYVKKQSVPTTDIKIDMSKYKRYYKTASELDNTGVPVVKMNYGYIDYLKKYINVEISNNEWNSYSNNIPVILGNNYKKDYKIGDKIKYKDEDLKVVAFFTQSVMYSNGGNPVDYSDYLDDAFVIPIQLSEDVDNYDTFYPVNIFGRSSSDDKSILNAVNHIKSIDPNIYILSYKDVLNDFMDKVNKKRKKELLQTIVISIMALIIINNVILFKIRNNINKIGILYSVGGNKRYISFKLFKEFFSLVFIGTVISIPISYKMNRLSIYFFYNENKIQCIVMALILLLIVIIIDIVASLSYLNKLTPKELIGGFVE